MVGKRHASEEIAAKLAQANELLAKGKTQREISKALGVSIMTYHRWKKMQAAERSAGMTGDIDIRSQTLNVVGPAETMNQLELENSRLRRLVTDLLLEKLKLEEEIRSRHETRFRRPR